MFNLFKTHSPAVEEKKNELRLQEELISTLTDTLNYSKSKLEGLTFDNARKAQSQKLITDEEAEEMIDLIKSLQLTVEQTPEFISKAKEKSKKLKREIRILKRLKI